MTNFEHYTKSPERLEELLYGAVDDALSAKGCSMRLKLPPDEFSYWESWLESEYVDGLPTPPMFPEEPTQNMTPEQRNAQIVTDKLQDILNIIQSNPTPFAQTVREILNEAIGGLWNAAGGKPHGT